MSDLSPERTSCCGAVCGGSEKVGLMSPPNCSQEMAILTGLSKRDGKALIISISASHDAHPFSIWLDRNAPGVYRQEHRPTPGLPADDVASLIEANPGTKVGIGPSLSRLKEDAALAIARGGSALSRFRLYSRNERVAEDNRTVLLTQEEWLHCETVDLPERSGAVVIGIDLGGFQSFVGLSARAHCQVSLQCRDTSDSISQGVNSGV